MWRFLPAADPKPFVTLDADDKLDESSIYMADVPRSIQNWLKSDKPFYQRGLTHFNLLIPISAGMWGAKGTKEGYAPIPDIQQRMEKYCSNWYGCDEAFLTKEIWPEFVSKGLYKAYPRLEIGILSLLILIMVAIILIRLIRTRTK